MCCLNLEWHIGSLRKNEYQYLESILGLSDHKTVPQAHYMNVYEHQSTKRFLWHLSLSLLS